MNTQKMKLKRISTNKLNPRTITEQRFQSLVDSILSFPKMMEIRPIVIDTTFEALGGNMRTNALNYIAAMAPQDLASRLGNIAAFSSKTKAERDRIVKFWGEWLESPYAYTIMADQLTEDEKKQFIIKDNLSYGTWDYDALANKWDNDALRNWGMEIWDTNPVNFAQADIKGADEQESADDEKVAQNGSECPSDANFDGQLPPELQGIDLSPDELPKIEGDDERPCDYIIITYEQSQKDELLSFLGIDPNDFTNHVCYSIEELEEMRHES